MHLEICHFYLLPALPSGGTGKKGRGGSVLITGGNGVEGGSVLLTAGQNGTAAIVGDSTGAHQSLF